MQLALARALEHHRGKAHMKRYDQVAGFILAGGSSTRMGRDKALLEIGGVPLLVRTARLLEPLAASVTVVGTPDRYAHLGLRVVPDDYPAGTGPLGGIATALRISTAEWNLVAGCDLPYLSEEWLDWLMARALASRADAIVPETPQGLEPLCAMYRSRCATTLAAAVAKGVRKVTDGFAGLAMERITPADWGARSSAFLFTNMNTPQDYKEAKRRLELKSSH